jgi:hypothetical protein
LAVPIEDKATRYSDRKHDEEVRDAGRDDGH